MTDRDECSKGISSMEDDSQMAQGNPVSSRRYSATQLGQPDSSHRWGLINTLRRRGQLSATRSPQPAEMRQQPSLGRRDSDLHSQLQYLETQNAQLTTRVLQLQPHEPSISDDEMRALYSSIHGESQRLSGSYFEFPDLENETHVRIVREREEFRVVRENGTKIFADLARARAIEAVVENTWDRVFGAAKDHPVTESILAGLLGIERAMEAVNRDKLDLLPSLASLRADTTRLLVQELFGLDLKTLVEDSTNPVFRWNMINKNEALQTASALIMKAAETDMQRLLLIEIEDGSEHGRPLKKATQRSLERMVASSIFLILSMRLSRQFFAFRRVAENQEFEEGWMEPFGDGGRLDARREAMFAVDRALGVFDDQVRAWRCVEKATVILKPEEGEGDASLVES